MRQDSGSICAINVPYGCFVERVLHVGDDVYHSMPIDRSNMLSQRRTMSSPVVIEVCMEAMSTGLVHKVIVDKLAATRSRVHIARAGLLSRQNHPEIVIYSKLV